MRQREIERQRETQRGRDRERDTERQRERQRDTERDRERLYHTETSPLIWFLYDKVLRHERVRERLSINNLYFKMRQIFAIVTLFDFKACQVFLADIFFSIKTNINILATQVALN